MASGQRLRLCGGTFFFLLLKADENSKSSQDLRLRDFLGVVEPRVADSIEIGESLHSYASKFRNCKDVPRSGKYFHLGDEKVCSMFRDELESEPGASLKRVINFADKYIPQNSRPWLVRALLELIESDDNINNTDMMYVKPNFSPAYKEEIIKENCEISFYDFLLGIWFYVYEHCGDNTVGERTIQKWTCSNKPNVEGTFDSSSIGTSEKYRGIKIIEEKKTNEERIEELTEEQQKAVYVMGDDIVPDLQSFNPKDILFMSTKETNTTIKGKFVTYIAKSYAKYSKRRTFIYETERTFRSFYVCNDIVRRTRGMVVHHDESAPIPIFGEKFIKNAKIGDFTSPRSVIIGQGGLGKTMMAINLFLSSIDDYIQDEILPIFTPISDYVPCLTDLTYLISKSVTRFDSKLELSDVLDCLENKKTVLLLDGLDEIKKEFLPVFIKELDYISDVYPNTQIIILSRDMPAIRTLNNFLPYELQPLREEQAVAMIRKLDPEYIDENIKKKFISDLQNGRFRFNEKEKREFLGNPLFLTIMLISYSQTNNVPTQRYLFYEQAYRAMASRHDALKGITRDFRTGLNEREFQKYFGQFCADSYADFNLQFGKSLFEKYIQKVIDDNNLCTTVDDFFADITEKLCLIYLDGIEYRFIHRSFQEYFAAYYFTTLMDDEFTEVFDLLVGLDKRMVSDETIAMLYGLDKKRCELYVIIPYLQKIFQHNDDREDYREYIRKFYPTVEYVTGDLEDEMANNSLHFAIHKFILSHYGIQRYISGDDFSYSERWADRVILYYEVADYRTDRQHGDWEWVDAEGLAKYYDVKGNQYKGVEVREAGYICSVDLENVVNYPEENKNLWMHINDDFTLKNEFDDAKLLLSKLKNEYDKGNTKKRKFGLN